MSVGKLLAPRYLVPLALIFTTALAAAAIPAWWGIVLTGLLAAALLIALWDFVQDDHALRRNYPLLARVRWMMEDLRPFVRAYFIEGDLEGRPFSHQARALVYARAKGELDSHPMGTELDVYSDEYEWLSHSVVPNDGAQDTWRVPVGEGQCAKPYSSSLLNISAMSFGSLSAKAIEALNYGAREGDFAHNTGEGSISKYHRAHNGDLIWEIGSGYFGCRTDDGGFDAAEFADNAAPDQVKMIEVKLSQGAKPGHGGVLPGSKVTEEIAEARGIPVGEDCNSPAAHRTFSTPIEMLEWLQQLRELSGGKPVGIKLCVGQPHEVLAIGKAMLETGLHPDFITVDGAEGGTGAAPLELSNSVGMPLREGTIWVRNMLVGTGMKDRVKLATSGKIHSGAQMAKSFAMGADWCNAARPFMFALGCVQSMQCHRGDCPTGVATQEEWRQKGLVVEDKGPRVARFQKQTLHSLREIVVAMGLESPWKIEPRDMRERVNGARSDALDRIYSFLEPDVLVADPDSTKLAHHWAAARADSFRRFV
ncbi:Glutamate synthase (ferredoxin) [Alteripontixanthobacter maritimus]|uniref:Glutamate synthase (Ferredoxin) n=1 Tax=Alteripontixanthobacter maritimus TaxID=2161824 RepID=A0A369QE05_9SPHN|nr:FMN-binding glutamate synthase family protein [Alteripontixanthobacter maritimus]RDC61149.1 Glutamate synthase (ferredoxin) [Alteripontixanthobacter maritimus]